MRPAARLLLLPLAAAQHPAPGGRCDEMFLGTDIGWVDVMEYHDADGSCAISMQELGNVCKTHYQACLSFLQNSHTTKDGSVQCGDQEMMNRMMKGGDVCCDYTDGRNCGTFPVSGPQDTAEECADTGAVDTTSLSLRMPLNRNCRYWVTALRFPNVVLPKAAVIDEAYVLFPVRTAAESWSTTEAVGLVVVAVALVVGYNRRYGRARGAKYDRVQTEEEGRSLVDDDLGDFDVEGDVAPVQRDRRGNPVAKAIVSEGATADSTKFVYRDSCGNVR